MCYILHLRLKHNHTTYFIHCFLISNHSCFCSSLSFISVHITTYIFPLSCSVAACVSVYLHLYPDQVSFGFIYSISVIFPATSDRHLRALDTLGEDLDSIPNSHSSSQLLAAPVPGALMSSSGLRGTGSMWCMDIHASKTPNHMKIKVNKS